MAGKLLNEKFRGFPQLFYFLEVLGANSRTKDHETSPKAFGVVVIDEEAAARSYFPAKKDLASWRSGRSLSAATHISSSLA